MLPFWYNGILAFVHTDTVVDLVSRRLHRTFPPA